MLLSSEPVNILPRLQQAIESSAVEAFGDPFVIGLTSLGLCLLIAWQVWVGGLRALENAPFRRNRMNPLVPVSLLFAWLFLMVAANASIEAFFKGHTDSFEARMTSYAFNAVLEITFIIVMAVLACLLFARGLKGLGFNPKTIGRDLRWSLVHLTAVYPLILLGLWLLLLGGRFFSGPDFMLQTHESIELLVTTDHWLIRVMVAVFAVFIVPVFEELLFRGFVQTSIRTWTANPWLAIGAASLLFAILHPWQHQLSLFFLSCGFGYAYERSGSLFRPILMHFLFNGFNIAVSLYQSASV
jgi:membrane protease YdiL (CAAX protease family)